MSHITTFFQQSIPVRIVLVDETPWFVATDICIALEIQNVTQAVSRLDEDERSMFNIGRQGKVCVINESGLYSLILGSRKPEAKKFKKWVTSEVLPSIRKTGSYVSHVSHQPATRQRIGKITAETRYFDALREITAPYANQNIHLGSLWIGLTRIVFAKLEIDGLDQITWNNVDAAISIIRADIAGNRDGLRFAQLSQAHHVTLLLDTSTLH